MFEPRIGTDVDDLQDIGNLEGYVQATGVMLFFLSKHYFYSKNCLREIQAALAQEKPCARQVSNPGRTDSRC